jgi:hypothetical protein
VYGPVRTVVWQGSVGDRRPYADLTRDTDIELRTEIGFWEVGQERDFRLMSRVIGNFCGGDSQGTLTVRCGNYLKSERRGMFAKSEFGAPQSILIASVKHALAGCGKIPHSGYLETRVVVSVLCEATTSSKAGYLATGQPRSGCRKIIRCGR